MSIVPVDPGLVPASARLSIRSSVLLVMLLLGSAASSARADRGEAPARKLLAAALERTATRAQRVSLLGQVTRLTRRYPRSSYAAYARGRIASALRRNGEAVRAYRRAITLNPRLVSAHYNLGVVLGRMKRPRRALRHFIRATHLDKRGGDAPYNAAQTFYNLKDYRNALRYWKIVLRREPGSFTVTKKILQTQYALNQFGAAALTRTNLWRLHRTSRDPRIRRLTKVIVDQFHLRGYHVYVFEAFSTGGSFAYVYEFKLTKQGRTIGSVNLETSAVLRQRMHSLIGVRMQGVRRRTKYVYRTRPSYRRLRADVKRIIQTL